MRWWHRPGKNSGCEDVDNQLKVLARGCSLKQECRDEQARWVLRHRQVREATVVPIKEES